MPVAPNKLTNQQQAALDAREFSVSLAAGAGCGKTFVLTERFIAQLDPTAADALDLDQLVAITFTDAAAREMRQRIRQRCYAALQTAPQPQRAAWQRLMRSIDAARISTIHAFCGALLRSHAVEAGLDPQFQVLDAPEADLLRLQTIDDLVRRLLIERQEDVMELAAKRGIDRLRTDLSDFSRPRSADALARWRDATPQQLVARWVQLFEDEAGVIAAAELVDCGEFHELKRLADPALAATDKLRAHLAVLAESLADLELRRRPPAEVAGELRGLAMVKGVCSAKDWRDPSDYARYRDAAKAFREEKIDNSILKQTIDLDAAHEAARLGLALVRLAGEVTQALDAAKARRNQLEFDDLLVRAHALLSRDEDLRRRATRGVQLLMVDEFQDTNPLQTRIIQAFCGPAWHDRGLFTVGDQKQSIYRFNGAEPRVSNELRQRLPARGQLSLTVNFRSQPAVVDFVNAIFGGEFPDYEPLVARRRQATAPPAVEFLWTPGPKSIDALEAGPEPPAGASRRAGAARDARALEARWIARRLRQLVDAGAEIVVDAKSGEPRPLRWGDVAVLLRSLTDAQVYEEALRDAGIDYYLAGGHAFYAQQEIYDVLNLLTAVASRIDDIALAGALRSPLFALTDETLFWLVQSHDSLNAALDHAARGSALPAQLAPAEAEKLRRAVATIHRLRREKDRLLVAELLALALALTGYDAVLLAEFLGPRKVANVEKLVEQARAHDRTSPGDLQGFIVQLSEFVAHAPKEALAATQAEGDVVRLMTIHGAKGLEFPLVVLPDLERPRLAGGGQPVLDLELGPLVPIADREGWVGRNLYQRIEDLQDLEERKRLFYVACTRAADYLILSSAIDDLEHPKSDWLQLVDRSVSLVDGALRRPLPAGLAAPEVLVTASEPPAIGDAESRPRGPDLAKLVARARDQKSAAAASVPADAGEIPVERAARRRFSFSRITGALVGRSVERDDQPAPLNDSEPARFAPDGRVLGNLVHAVLERIDFRQPADVRSWCDFLAPQWAPIDTPRYADRAAELVERFLATDRAARLAQAATLRREVEFLLAWPPGGAAWHGRYLHGYLDLLYQDADGRWRLLDYKTNRAADGHVPQIAARYELQMLAYSVACERTLGQPLAECTLVVLDAGAEHSYIWSKSQREAGIAHLTAAMDTMTLSP